MSMANTKTFSRPQRGVSLIVVMLILVVVSLLGVGAAQIAFMGERGARNDRDMQVAWQSSEAALLDAECDIHGPCTSTPTTRRDDFTNFSAFTAGCSTTGLCALNQTGLPAWLTVDFTATGSSAQTVAYGTYTGQSFAAGIVGVQPSKKPRYIVEVIPDRFIDRDATKPPTAFLYRVTAMGFGPRDDIQSIHQILYRN